MKSDVDSLSTKIGCIISELRKDKKITQKELADIMNVSKGMISHYESGRNVPPLDLLIKLSKYFEVPVDYLLGLCGSKVEYKRLADEFTEGITYGEIVNLLYSLSVTAKNHFCYFLKAISNNGKSS